ncbi:MAG: glycerol kinase GlpK [Leptolyngbyaceae cyanobacterium HOT.MB2.61]|nr:glycerol kinase GlpK [Leptolyngbyaceae cyanobacterium HOT.MB2.61]
MPPPASPQYILALDLGTTGNRAFLFDRESQIVGSAYKELTQYYPQPGWLEHDPLEIWRDAQFVIQTAIQNAGIEPALIAAIGLTVQRETCLLWDRTTGQPLHRAIVWQDRRTAPLCNQLREQGYTQEIFDRTGLVIDAYFSATKLAWLLEHAVTSDINLENVLAGTIDTWVLWNLTGRRVHATDDTNASRTMLFNIATRQWDDRLLELFNIPSSILPKVQPSLSEFGVTDANLFGAEIPITGILGDQQAALFGQGCDHPGLMKCTYGTGCFLVAHTGNEIVRSRHQLLSTIAWTTTPTAHTPHPISPLSYALEGSMFTTGACIQWLRDGMGLIQTASETESLANQVPDNGGVYFVPALSGLGAPHWDMGARGAFLGITGGVKREHMVRAVLEAIAFQVKEVVLAIREDCGAEGQGLKVDGGACENNFLMQFQADVLGIPVERPVMRDSTVLGTAFAAGLTAGFWNDYGKLISQREIDRIFEPGAGVSQALNHFATWQKAVERAKYWVA